MAQFVRKSKKNRTFWPKKILSPPLGWPPMGKNQKKFFFNFLHQNDSIREKKQTNIFELVTNRKVVDNVENYLNIKFQQKLMTRTRENGQKHHLFLKIAYKNNLRVFLENSIFFYKQFFKKSVFGHFLENAALVLAEISYLDSSQHYLQLLYWHHGREKSSSPIFRPF